LAVESDGEFEAVVAEDGAKGLRMARAERPDVILLDMLMPGMDGYEVCRQLKSDPLLNSIPVVFLSARAEYETAERMKTAGANGCLGKPFDPMELSGRIREIIDEAKQSDRI
jgi:CheY-like chemotaxis protein